MCGVVAGREEEQESGGGSQGAALSHASGMKSGHQREPPAPDDPSTEAASSLKRSHSDAPERDEAGGEAEEPARKKGLLAVYGFRTLAMVTIFNLNALSLTCVSIGGQLLLQQLNVPGPRIGVLLATVSLPFAVSPAIAYLSDNFPIRGYRKLYYLVGAIGLVAVGLSVVAATSANAPRAAEFYAGGMVITNLGFSVVNCLGQGYLSQCVKAHPESGPLLMVFNTIVYRLAGLGSLLSVVLVENFDLALGIRGGQWAIIGGGAVGSVFGLGPFLLNWLGEERVPVSSVRRPWAAPRTDAPGAMRFLIAAQISAVVVSTVCALNDVGGRGGVLAMGLALALALASLAKAVLKPLIANLVVFAMTYHLCNIIPSPGVTMYFYLDGPAEFPAGPHFSKSFLFFQVQLFVVAASVTASMAYPRLCKPLPFRHVVFAAFLGCALVQAADSLMFSRSLAARGVPDAPFVLAKNAAFWGLQSAGQMAVSLLAQKACPAGQESTVMALFASLSGFAFTVAASLASYASAALGVSPSGVPGVDESAVFANLWLVNLLSCLPAALPLALALAVVPVAAQDVALVSPDEPGAGSVVHGSLFSRWRAARAAAVVPGGAAADSCPHERVTASMLGGRDQHIHEDVHVA